MPSLGGLLKKRRTRDSASLSKESDSTSSPAGNHNNAQTSPVAADHPAPRTASSTNDNPQSHANHPNNTADSSMQQAVPQNQPAAQHPQTNNAASIQNLINTPHQAGHQQQQQQQQTVIRSDARSTKGKYSLDDFSLQRTLGTGSFGRVHLVQSTHNHRFYALKVLKKAQVVKMKQIEHTNDERRMLSRSRHPFLVTLWGTWQDSRNLYMVMDFVEGGELFSLLRKSQVSCGSQLVNCDR